MTGCGCRVAASMIFVSSHLALAIGQIPGLYIDWAGKSGQAGGVSGDRLEPLLDGAAALDGGVAAIRLDQQRGFAALGRNDDRFAA